MQDPAAERRAALEGLGEAGLARLLRRVPAAREFVTPHPEQLGPRQQPGLGELGRLFATEYGIASALSVASTLAQQVLGLAAWQGGHLERDEAVAATGDLETRWPGALDGAAQELADLLLSDPAQGFVHLRPGVAGCIRFPGLPLREGVQFVNSDEIARRLYRLTGLKVQDQPTRKLERVALLEAVLRNGEMVASALVGLPAFVLSALEVLLDAAPHAASEFGVSWLRHRYGREEPRDVVEVLEDLGLVDVDRNAQTVTLWLDVAVGWRGGLHADWSADPAVTPLPLDQVLATVPAAVGRLDRLLARWARTPPPALRSGGLGTKTIKAAAAELDQPVGEVGLLANLAFGLGLLDAVETGTSGRGRNRITEYVWAPNEDAVAFVASPTVAQWVELVRTWAEDPAIDDADGLPAKVGLDPARDGRVHAVERFLQELLALDPGTGLSLADFTERCDFRTPALLPPARTASFVAAARILGLVPNSGPVGLFDAARTLLTDPARLADALPSTADRVVVQADHTVIAPPDLDATVSALLERIAQLESDAGARIYRINERSLRRAFAEGLDAAAVLEALHAHSAVGVPPTVVRLVEDVAAGHGRLRTGAATSYLVVDDAALLPAALKVRAARLRQVAPTVAISDLPLDRVLAALRKAGVETVPDAEGEPAPARRRTPVDAAPPARGAGGTDGPGSPGGGSVDLSAVPAVLVDDATLEQLAATVRAAPGWGSRSPYLPPLREERAPFDDLEEFDE